MSIHSNTDWNYAELTFIEVELSKKPTHELKSNITPADLDQIIYSLSSNMCIVANVFPTAQNESEQIWNTFWPDSISSLHVQADINISTNISILISIFSSPVYLHRISYTDK